MTLVKCDPHSDEGNLQRDCAEKDKVAKPAVQEGKHRTP